MDASDRDLLARSLRQATERHSGPALDRALDDLGWPDALADDPRAAISTLFELQGATGSTSSALDQVLVHALDLPTALVTPPTPSVVLPAVGTWERPGTFDGDRLDVAGLADAALAAGPLALVLASSESSDVAVTVPTHALELRPVEGIDPDLGLVEVAGGRLQPDGVQLIPAPAWPAAVARARLALSHQLVGAARHMLELARTHALERVQFGRPIGSFQAVRHRLAETLVAIETAEAVIDAAWLDGSVGTAAMAKAVSGREARTAARHCQQVLAGIGFTTEHPLHRYVRRVMVLDGLFGTSRSLTSALGDELLRTRKLPPLLPL